MPARASGGPSHSLQALAVRPRADELQPSSPRGQYGPGGLRHGHFQSSLRDILTWCRVFSLPSSTGVPHAKGSCVSSLMNKSLSVHPPHLVGRLGGHGGRVVRPGRRQSGGSVSRRFMPGAPVRTAVFKNLLPRLHRATDRPMHSRSCGRHSGAVSARGSLAAIRGCPAGSAALPSGLPRRDSGLPCGQPRHNSGQPRAAGWAARRCHRGSAALPPGQPRAAGGAARRCHRGCLAGSEAAWEAASISGEAAPLAARQPGRLPRFRAGLPRCQRGAARPRCQRRAAIWQRGADILAARR